MILFPLGLTALPPLPHLGRTPSIPIAPVAAAVVLALDSLHLSPLLVELLQEVALLGPVDPAIQTGTTTVG